MSVPPPLEGTEALERVNGMLRDYRTLFGQNPVGNNAEIMRSIMGENPKGAHLGPPPGMALNQSGELIDEWGTPIFFHALAKDHMEIRSAGPDRILWNGDDVVLK